MEDLLGSLGAELENQLTFLMWEAPDASRASRLAQTAVITDKLDMYYFHSPCRKMRSPALDAILWVQSLAWAPEMVKASFLESWIRWMHSWSAVMEYYKETHTSEVYLTKALPSEWSVLPEILSFSPSGCSLEVAS